MNGLNNQRELLKREQMSVGDFQDVSYAAELYHTMTEQVEQGQKVQRVGVVGEPEPQLPDYYEYLFIVLGMGDCFYASSFSTSVNEYIRKISKPYEKVQNS